MIESHDQMLNLKAAGMSFSQVVIRYVEKDVNTLGEYVINSDEGIFQGCYINSTAYTVFNKNTNL